MDWLDAKGMPVYKVIDPIEKAGVPSLPVFFALFLIMIYLALGSLVGTNFAVQISDSSKQTGLVANVTIFKDSNQVFFGTTGSDGIVRGSLPPGDYKLSAVSMGCTPISGQKITVANGATIPIPMSCGGTLSQKNTQFCFSPDTKKLQLEIQDPYGAPLDLKNIKSTDNILVEKNKFYIFSGDSLSSDRLGFDDLAKRSASDCIKLKTPGETSARGTVIVVLQDSKGTLLPNEVVRLVDENDSEVDVVSQAYTDSLGEALFSGPIGKNFRIFVPSPQTGNSSSFFSPNISTFSNRPQRFVVQLGSASPTKVIVKSGNVTLEGVWVQIVDNGTVIKEGSTTLDGVTFGGVSSKQYLGLFYKIPGYRAKTDNVIGGQVNIIKMNSITPGETGAIDVETANSQTDLPYTGVTVRMYSCSDPTCGSRTISPYPKLTTDDGGTGRFDWVVPGTYCLIASKGRGTATNCAENTVTVAAGEVAGPVHIKVDPLRFTITANFVTDDTEAPVIATEIKLLDSSMIVKTSAKTNFNGRVNFSGEDGKYYFMTADFTKDGKRYAVNYRVPNTGVLYGDVQVVVRVRPVTPTVNLVNISMNGVDAGTTLTGGSIYNLHFALGVPNTDGGKWDSVKMEIGSDFVDGVNVIRFTDMNLQASYKASISNNNDNIPDFTKTITLGTDYSPADTVLEFDVPIQVDNTFSTQKLTNITYKATWTKGSKVVTDPVSDYKKTAVTLSPSTIFNYKDIQIGLALINRNTGAVGSLPASGLQADIDNTDLSVAIINKGANVFKDPIEITSTGKVKFQNISSTTGIPSVDSSQTKASVTAMSIDPTSTGAVRMALKSFHVGIEYISVKIGGVEAATGTILIQGNEIIYAKMSPTNVYDLSRNLTITLKDSEGKTIVNPQIRSLTLGGSAVNGECKYTAGWLPGNQKIKPVFKDASLSGIFTVDLINDCQLRSTVGSIIISGEPILNDLLGDTKTVQTCISSKDVSGDVGQGQETSVDLELNVCNDLDNIAFEKVTASSSNCGTVCSLKNGNVDLLSSVSSVGTEYDRSKHAIPLKFLYNGVGAEKIANIVVNYRMVSYMPNELAKNVTRDYPGSLTINIVKPITPGESFTGLGLFVPIEVQKYSDLNIDCKNRYCNLEQALMFVKAKTMDFKLDAANNGDISPVEFNLVDVNPSPPQVQVVLEAVLGHVVNPGAPANGDSGFWLTTDPNFMPKPGKNIAYVESKDQYTNIWFENKVALPQTIDYLNAYMPWQDKIGFGTDFFANIYRTNTTADNVLGMLAVLWGKSGQGATDNAAHLIRTATCADLSTQDCKSLKAKIGNVDPMQGTWVYRDGNTIKIVGGDLRDRMIETLTALFDKNDALVPKYTLKRVGDALTFGPTVLNVNFSDGRFSTHDAALAGNIITLIKNQIVNIDVTNDDILDQSFMAIVDGTKSVAQIYDKRFGNRWNAIINGASGQHGISQNLSIGWSDGSGYTIVSPKDANTICLLKAWNGVSSSCTNYEKISGDLVVGYKVDGGQKIADMLRDIAVNIDSNVYSSAIKIQESGTCEIRNVQTVEGRVVGDVMQPGGIYLVTVRENPDKTGTYIVISTQLKAGTPAKSACIIGTKANNAVLVLQGNDNDDSIHIYDRNPTTFAYDEIGTIGVGQDDSDRMDASASAVDLNGDGLKESVAIATLAGDHDIKVNILRNGKVEDPVFDEKFDFGTFNYVVVRTAAFSPYGDGKDYLFIIWNNRDDQRGGSYNWGVLNLSNSKMVDRGTVDTYVNDNPSLTKLYQDRQDADVVAIDTDKDPARTKDTVAFMAVSRTGMRVWKWNAASKLKIVHENPDGPDGTYGHITAFDYNQDGKENEIMVGFTRQSGNSQDYIDTWVGDLNGNEIIGKDHSIPTELSNTLVATFNLIPYDRNGDGVKESVLIGYQDDSNRGPLSDNVAFFEILNKDNPNRKRIYQIGDCKGIEASRCDSLVYNIDTHNFLVGTTFRPEGQTYDYAYLSLADQSSAFACLSGRNDRFRSYVTDLASGSEVVNKIALTSACIGNDAGAGTASFDTTGDGNFDRYTFSFVEGENTNSVRIFEGDINSQKERKEITNVNTQNWGTNLVVSYYKAP